MFKKLWRFLKSLRAESIPSRTTAPIGKQPSFGFIPEFFVIIGHNIKDQGARLKFGTRESEWVWNNPVGDYILEFIADICPAIDAYKILRPIGTYGHQVRSVKNAIKKITNGLRSFAVSLHFNSGGGVGNENLIAKGTKEHFDNYFADMLSDVLEVALGIPQRRKDGVFEVSSSHNGAGMINGVAEVGCMDIIVEPGFDHDHPQARVIFGYPKRYALILSETIIITYLKRGFIEKKHIKKELKYWDVETLKPRKALV